MNLPMPIQTDGSTPRWMDKVGSFVIIAITFTVVFLVVSPYFGLIPATDASITSSIDALIQNVFLIMIGFLFGGSISNRKKDDSINLMARTNLPTPPTTNGAPTP